MKGMDSQRRAIQGSGFWPPLQVEERDALLGGMFTRSMFKTLDMVRQCEILQRISKMVDEGTLRSTSSKTVGKTVLSGW